MEVPRIPTLENTIQKVCKKENEANLSLIIGIREDREEQAL